jgi:hypothetical protein
VRIKSAYFLLLLFCFESLNSIGQNEEIIDVFSVETFGQSVLLNFRINSGYNCNGIDVLHSTDSVNFTEIYSFEGICGSTTESISYQYTDVYPEMNSVNYYRLYLGGPGFSWIVSTFVLDLQNASLVKPNPIISTSELLFENNGVEDHQLQIFDLSGALLFTANTNEDRFFISQAELPKGTFVYEIRNLETGLEMKGKFIVQ